ncbi:MAG: NAD(P)-binding protein [Planctomycetota bacterium]
MLQNTTPSVAIVGAGIAGLTLASRLQAHGVRPTVFDKGRGVSGRMSTRVTREGHTFDHGAPYFTARDPNFQEAVGSWVRKGIAGEWKAVVGTLRDGRFEVDNRKRTRYVGAPSSAICQSLAEELNVRSGVAVGAAERLGDAWRLSDPEGDTLGEYDWFVTSAPAPQSAGLLAAAPRFAEQASATKMTGCWAVMLASEGSIDLDYDGAFVDESPLSWVACDSSKPLRPIRISESGETNERWVLHGSPEWSEANIELDPAEATRQLLDAFWQATGLPPRPTIYERGHRWRYALPAEPLGDRFLLDADQRVGACGDWCGGPRVEGAYLSGRALADAMLSAM